MTPGSVARIGRWAPVTADGGLLAVLGWLTVLLVGYYALWAVVHVLVTVVGVRTVRRRGPQERERERRRERRGGGDGRGHDDRPPMTVAVPAYDEAGTVVAAVESVLAESYPVSVVVVDDGSTDGTFQRVADRFGLVAADGPVPDPRTAPAPRAAVGEPGSPADGSRSAPESERERESESPSDSPAGSRSPADGSGGATDPSGRELLSPPPAGEWFVAPDRPLAVRRQDNAGKAAALNAVLARCETPLFGVVDADTVLESGCLSALAAPFEDEAVVAAGGSFRVGDVAAAEGSDPSGGLPASWFQRFQALEQLRAFILRQAGRSALGCMVHVFGACSLYRTDLVRSAGGFDRTETEDFELAVRLRRHCRSVGRAAEFVHVPGALAWTAVPETAAELNEQRQRWVRGLTTTVGRHWRLLGRPAHGRAGLVGLPYFVFGEILWPISEAVAYLLVPAAWLLGAVSTATVGAFLVGLLLAGPVASGLSILGTYGPGGYDAADRWTLLAVAVLERLVWRPPQVLLGAASAADEVR